MWKCEAKMWKYKIKMCKYKTKMWKYKAKMWKYKAKMWKKKTRMWKYKTKYENEKQLTMAEQKFKEIMGGMMPFMTAPPEVHNGDECWSMKN